MILLRRGLVNSCAFLFPMTHYQTFLTKLTQNLALLREREAKYGGSAPLELLNQIADHQDAITLTEQAIGGNLTDAEWREALQPLLIAIQARPGDETASSVNIGDIGGSIQHSVIAGRDVQQITVNVVNLLGQAMQAQNQALEPAVQAIVDLAMAQVQAKEPGIAQRYPQNPAGYSIPFQDALTELLEADRGLAARLDALLTQAAKARPPSAGTTYKATLKGSGAIAQGPGAQAVGARGVMVGGNVGGSIITGSIGGDYVGGDKVGGDKVGRDKITGLTGADLAQMFQDIYSRIEARPADPNVDKAEVKDTVQKIEQEVEKGEEANPSKVERWLKTLKGMAPDIGDVTIACLTNPAAGVAMVIKKIAEKAKVESSKA
ncbi:MAG: hypothetical protein HC875_17735 [Anaerolineales bacterium]|nr:hypothetical protein [Anaerolineales bacterium]